MAIKSSPMKGWSLYFQPPSRAAKKALKNDQQNPSWGDRSWGYPKWPSLAMAPEGGPCRFYLASSLPVSSRPTAEKSAAPCASKRGPWSGAWKGGPRGTDPFPLLCTGPACPHPAGPPLSDEGPGSVGPGWGRPRGLQRTVERAKGR